MSDKEEISILYDGECPFCSQYVRRMRLQKNFNVILVNARDNTAFRQEMTALGHDLDQGMIVRYGGRVYYAEQAMMILSLLATPSDYFNKMMILLFRSERRARLLYPVFSRIRRLTVFLLGRGKIGNLNRS